MYLATALSSGQAPCSLRFRVGVGRRQEEAPQVNHVSTVEATWGCADTVMGSLATEASEEGTPELGGNVMEKRPLQDLGRKIVGRGSA